MLQNIALKHLNSIHVPTNKGTESANCGMSFIAEMLNYGYTADTKLMEKLGAASTEVLTALYEDVMPVLKNSIGANEKHRPLFANFPNNLMDDTNTHNFAISLAQLDDKGTIRVKQRKVAYESYKLKTLTYASTADINAVFNKIVLSKDSISEDDKNIVKYFINNTDVQIPTEIPFKENMCLVAGTLLLQNKFDNNLVKDTTDILRIMAFINDADMTLSNPTKYKSLPRKMRKLLISALSTVAKEEDFMLHKQQWIRALHNLHVGDFSKALYTVAKKLRENVKIHTFNTRLETCMADNDIDGILKLLVTRPGIFARNIANLLTTKEHREIECNTAFEALKGLHIDDEYKIQYNKIIIAFNTVIDRVPTRNLTQLWGSMKTRYNDVDKRVVFPKGMVSRAYLLQKKLNKIPAEYIDALLDSVKDTLIQRFRALEPLGNVFIDTDLYECPLPTAQRSASTALKQVARGTRMKMNNKDNLRFFIHWTNIGEQTVDVDLSAAFFDDKMNFLKDIAYYNLDEGKCHHSGDIVDAPSPEGASEFIDVNIDYALNDMKARYVVMNVLVFTRQTFEEVHDCYVGWMARDAVDSNEVYDP